MMPKWLRISLIVIPTAAVVYLLGPKPAERFYEHKLPAVPAAGPALEAYIQHKEAGHRLKPDNEARIVWQDSGRHKTPYSVVYLHGFFRQPEEGKPGALAISLQRATGVICTCGGIDGQD